MCLACMAGWREGDVEVAGPLVRFAVAKRESQNKCGCQ